MTVKLEKDSTSMVCLEESLHLSKKAMTAQLRFAKLHLNKTQYNWSNVLWTDDTKVEMHSTMFGENQSVC